MTQIKALLQLQMELQLQELINLEFWLIQQESQYVTQLLVDVLSELVKFIPLTKAPFQGSRERKVQSYQQNNRQRWNAAKLC
jgi:hypothetical protein